MIFLDKPQELLLERILLPHYHRGHLSLFRDSHVSVLVLPKVAPGPQIAELVISPISFRSWSDLWRVGLKLKDRKGLVRDVFRALSSRKLNVVMAETSSMDRESVHQLEIVCDATDYQSDADETSELRVARQANALGDLERGLIAEFLDDLTLTSHGALQLQIQKLYSLASARSQKAEAQYLYEEGGSAHAPLLKKLSLVRSNDGEFWLDLSGEIGSFLLESASMTRSPWYLLSSDTRECYARAYITDSPESILAPTIKHREKPGATASILQALAGAGFNVLTTLTRLLDAGKSGETELVITHEEFSGSSLREKFEEALSVSRLVRDYKIQVAYPSDYLQKREFNSMRVKKGVIFPQSARQSSRKRRLVEHVDTYSNRLANRRSREDEVKLAFARTAYEAEIRGRSERLKFLFVSCAYQEKTFVEKARIAAEARGFKVITGQELPAGDKAERIKEKIGGATQFLGIWTPEGGHALASTDPMGAPQYWPSPWMNWELGVARAYGLSCYLMIANDIHGDSWRKIDGNSVHSIFNRADYESVLASALENLDTSDPVAALGNPQARG